MLFSDEPDRDVPAVAVADRHAEDRLEEKNAFGMMPQGAVARIGDDLLGLVEPLVKRQIVLGITAPPADRAQGSVANSDAVAKVGPLDW